jgi:tetratricopeptide (TPR) repeat protein
MEAVRRTDVEARAAQAAQAARHAAHPARGGALRVVTKEDAASEVPKWLGYLSDAAAALFAQKAWKEGFGLSEIALGLSPNHPSGHILAGVVLRADGDYTQAEQAFRRALELDPENGSALANLGALIHDTKPEESLSLLRRAMLHDPSSDFIAQTYMLAVMSSGDWERGWNLYNRRTRFPAVGNQICKYPDTIDGHAGTWDGRTGKIKNRSAQVLLVGEEGIGERIMFASMVADVIKTGATPIIEMTSGFERFAPWFERSFPKLKIARGGENFAIDYHINIGDLGAMFRRKFSDFPKHKGYMTWDKERAAHFRHRLSPGPIVGVCYKSLASAGPHKSIPLEKWLPILSTPGVSFVDLQYQGTEKERNAHAPLLNHLPDLDLINDMDGLASLIGACDLVITVSSVTAHMAGAMGKPVWSFIPSRAGRMWFWGTRGEQSPWYPSMKLFRQALDGQWEPAIGQVAAALGSMVNDRAA